MGAAFHAMNEKVLSIAVDPIRERLKPGFFPVDGSDLIGTLGRLCVFLDRAAAEKDPAHKQIIPYTAVTHGERVLLYRRSAKAGESRLHHKSSLGFGGHINDRDNPGARDSNLILAGLVREINEEVFLPGIVRLGIVGFINDDSNPVGQVHLGVACVLELANDRFALNEPELVEARWARAEDVEREFATLESWSQFFWSQHLAALLASRALQPAGA